MLPVSIPVKGEADLETTRSTSSSSSSFWNLGSYAKQFFKGTIALLGFAAVSGITYLALSGFRSKGSAQNRQEAFSSNSGPTLEEVEAHENLVPQSTLVLNQGTYASLMDTTGAHAATDSLFAGSDHPQPVDVNGKTSLSESTLIPADLNLEYRRQDMLAEKSNEDSIVQNINSASYAYLPVIELSNIGDGWGVKFNGEAAGDCSGWSVSGAGDINGDGLDDLVIGAYSSRGGAGSSYVIFGQNTPWNCTIELSSLNGVNGFKINGEVAGDYSGTSISGVGDINGDGLDDLIIGAYRADPSSRANAGSSYVIFGQNTPWNRTVELSSLNGANGFKINGEVAGDYSGVSVSGAGDINGDGLKDLVIGATFADPSGRISAGSSYVIFGQHTPWNHTVELSSLNGINGFKMNGEAAYDYSGFSVSGAGDINGDGLDDLIIGAYGTDPSGRISAGSSYVIFGQHISWNRTIELSSLNGTNGFKINGESAGDLSGTSVSGAGDINGDGLDDLVIGAEGADPSGRSGAGSSYVIFGRNTPWNRTVELSSLNGANGFKINGEVAGDDSGGPVSGAGDINGDGLDDLVIGAREANPSGRSQAGSSYVIFGRNTPWNRAIELSSLNGTNGFKMNGEAVGDYSGMSVSGAGDINGDGWDDLVVGAYAADPSNRSMAGSSYVILSSAKTSSISSSSTGIHILPSSSSSSTGIGAPSSPSNPSSSVVLPVVLGIAGGLGTIGGVYFGYKKCRGYKKDQEEEKNKMQVKEMELQSRSDEEEEGKPQEALPKQQSPIEGKDQRDTVASASPLIDDSKESKETKKVEEAKEAEKVKGEKEIQYLQGELPKIQHKKSLGKEVKEVMLEVKGSELSSSALSSSEATSHPSLSTLNSPSSLANASGFIADTLSKMTPSEVKQMQATYQLDANRLRFGKELGKGPFGEVYEGTYLLGEVAIKKLIVERMTASGEEEFKNEISIMARSKHPNIVTLYGYTVSPSPYCIVMERMQISLYQLLQSKTAEELPLDTKMVIAMDMIAGLLQLHALSIVHRDLKSLNILLSSTLRAKLADFGLSKLKSEVRTMMKTTAMDKGLAETVQWMAPELLGLRPKYTKASDIFAYGVILWELVSHQVPYAKMSPHEVIMNVKKGIREKIPSECPLKFASLIRFCWDQDPNKRPSAQQIGDYLQSSDEEFKPTARSATLPTIQDS